MAGKLFSKHGKTKDNMNTNIQLTRRVTLPMLGALRVENAVEVKAIRSRVIVSVLAVAAPVKRVDVFRFA